MGCDTLFFAMHAALCRQERNVDATKNQYLISTESAYRAAILAEVDAERAYQNKKWGTEFDNLNTANDWIAYIVSYAGRAVTMPWNKDTFHNMLVKVMALCCAALEQEEYAPRHYDVPTSPTYRG